MTGIESSIYFMMAMLFVGMPAAVIGGIAWECRKQTRLADLQQAEEAAQPMDVADEDLPAKPR